MKEFEIGAFTNTLRQSFYDNFPYESDELKLKKHPKTPFHIRDIALGMPILSNGSYVFEIGNEYSEENYPYYHILQDSEVIRKRGRGTTKTKGSQAKVEKLSDRDYGRITYNAKTDKYTREYQRNVRGKRSRVDKATKIVVGSDGVVYKVNKNADYYYNKHFRYIDRILEQTLPFIAQDFGLRILSKKNTSLDADFLEQEREDMQHIRMLESFE